MSLETLAQLSPTSLRALVRLLDESREVPDLTRLLAVDAVPAELVDGTGELIQRLSGTMGSPTVVARALALVAGDREKAAEAAPHVEIVWSGPEGLSPRHRTTQAVVQQIFETFQKTLLLSTYVIDVDNRADDLFGGLAERMDREPRLEVQIFLNVPLPKGGGRPDEIVAAFQERFRTRIWPGQRLPDVWYDPRSLQTGAQRAVLHAKCLVADGKEAFVTSANFTEAAQGRNVELGVFLRGPALARGVALPFAELIATGRVQHLLPRDA